MARAVGRDLHPMTRVPAQLKQKAARLEDPCPSSSQNEGPAWLPLSLGTVELMTQVKVSDNSRRKQSSGLEQECIRVIQAWRIPETLEENLPDTGMSE